MESIVVYDVPHLVYWDWRIAADLFCGGIGVGAFLVAVLSSLYYKDRQPEVSRIGAILAPVFVILGLIFLLTELGRPFRLYKTVAGFNVSSPLSWGGPLQTIFIGVSVVYAYLWLKPGRERLRKIVGVIGVPFAVAVGAYHGWLLTIVRARQLWNSGPAMVAALIGFATTGMAAVLLVLCLMPLLSRKAADEAQAARAAFDGSALGGLRNILVVLLVLQCFTFYIWWIGMFYGTTDRTVALATANAELGPLFWTVGVGLGLVVPAALHIGEIVLGGWKWNRLNTKLAIATSTLVLIGGFIYRYAVLIAGQLS